MFIMRKFIGFILALVSLMLFLAGCGQDKLSVSSHHIQADGLAVVIKGKTNTGQVSYQIDGGKKKAVKVKNSSFIVMVPVLDKVQKVHLTAGLKKQTVKIDKTKSLGQYLQIKQKYEQGLVMSQLSEKGQKKIQTLSKQGHQLERKQQQFKKKAAADKAAMARGDALAKADLQKQGEATVQLKQEGQSLQKQQSQIQPALKQAQEKVKADRLPNHLPNGIHTLLNTRNFMLRANATHGDVNALALAVPVKAMRDKAQAKSFIVKFSLVASAVGADSKYVLQQFKKQLVNNKKSTKTTAKTIHSKGIDFSIGVSEDKMYIYLLK